MSNLNKRISETCIRIPARFSYCNVFSPKVNEDGTIGKYGVCVIIPKSDKETVDAIEASIRAAKEVGKTSKWGGKIPANAKNPLRDGDVDREDDPTFKGCWFFNATTKNRPGVRVLLNGQVSEALDADDFYSGCYGAVTINFFPYDTNGNRGVGIGLNNVIKTKDGDRLSGGRDADADFGDLTGDVLD